MHVGKNGVSFIDHGDLRAAVNQWNEIVREDRIRLYTFCGFIHDPGAVMQVRLRKLGGELARKKAVTFAVDLLQQGGSILIWPDSGHLNIILLKSFIHVEIHTAASVAVEWVISAGSV